MSNKVADVPVYDVLQQLKSEVFKDLRVCLPGSISGIDTATGTVSVSLGVMQKVAKQGLSGGLNIAYSDLTMCPVFSVQGGGVGCITPVKIGDECIVVFSDRCIDTWFTTGQANPLPSVRMHSINDGIVLVGVNSLKNPLLTPLLTNEGGICETKITVPTNGAKVVVNSVTHKINVSNGLAGVNSLYTILFNTLTALNADPALAPGTHAVLLAELARLALLLY